MISEWWTYGLSDFLLFSPRTYHRLLELYNRDTWPAQLLGLAFGLLLLVAMRSGATRHGWILMAALALSWLWLAWAFHHKRYSTINWTASYVALAFAAQALALFSSGVFGRFRFASPRNFQGWAWLFLFLFALIAYPFLAPLAGRPWSQAETFGLMPDPTALGTLGLLLLPQRAPLFLMIIPFSWCVLATLTMLAMQSPLAWLLPLFLLLVILARLPGLADKPLP